MRIWLLKIVPIVSLNLSCSDIGSRLKADDCIPVHSYLLLWEVSFILGRHLGTNSRTRVVIVVLSKTTKWEQTQDNLLKHWGPGGWRGCCSVLAVVGMAKLPICRMTWPSLRYRLAQGPVTVTGSLRTKPSALKLFYLQFITSQRSMLTVIHTWTTF